MIPVMTAQAHKDRWIYGQIDSNIESENELSKSLIRYGKLQKEIQLFLLLICISYKCNAHIKITAMQRHIKFKNMKVQFFKSGSLKELSVSISRPWKVEQIEQSQGYMQKPRGMKQNLSLKERQAYLYGSSGCISSH